LHTQINISKNQYEDRFNYNSSKILKRSIWFIINSFAGTSDKAQLIGEIQSQLDKSIYATPSFYFTQWSGHGTELARQAVAQSADCVVAVGGDGTINEVASSLVHTNTVLGIIPLGSGNGFARHNKIPLDIVGAIRVINKNRIHLVDMGKVNHRYFINVCSVGFDAKIAYLTKKNKNRGFWNYFKTTMKNLWSYHPIKATLVTRNHTFTGIYATIVIMNGSMYGYNFVMARDARMDDGMLDVLIVEGTSILGLFLLSLRFITRTVHKSPRVRYVRSNTLEITHTGKNYLQYDGEGLVDDEKLQIQLIPKALKIMVPKIRQDT
jgi:diacylglycerol kinase (ATP)